AAAAAGGRFGSRGGIPRARAGADPFARARRLHLARHSIPRAPARWPMIGRTYLSVGLAALALKLHYSHATVDDPAWILRPTAPLVGWVVGQPLSRNPDLGWMAADRAFVIAPACAGVNFLILVFALPAAGFAHRFWSSRERWAWIAGVACAAYAF